MEHNIEFNYYIFTDVNAKIPIAGFMNKKAAYDFLYTCKSGAICIAKEYLDENLVINMEMLLKNI